MSTPQPAAVYDDVDRSRDRLDERARRRRERRRDSAAAAFAAGGIASLAMALLPTASATSATIHDGAAQQPFTVSSLDGTVPAP